MLEIKVTLEETSFEATGDNVELASKVGFAMHCLINVLRETGCSEDIIDGIYRIAKEAAS